MKPQQPHFIALLAFAALLAAASAGVVSANLVNASETIRTQRTIDALRELAVNPHPDAGLIDTVSQVADGDADVATRIAAIETLNAWMIKQPDRLTGEISAHLAVIAEVSVDTDVRGHALQALALHRSPLPQAVLHTLAKAAQNDSSLQNRDVAALALGAAADSPELALRALTVAFAATGDIDLRRSVLSQIVRVGGSDALPVLHALKLDDPLLQQDVQDYAAILASGESDADVVFEQKIQLDGARGTLVGLHRHED